MSVRQTPTAFRPSVQGWPALRGATPGCQSAISPSPEGVASASRRVAILSGLWAGSAYSQGSSQARNPGLNDGIPSGFADALPRLTAP